MATTPPGTTPGRRRRLVAAFLVGIAIFSALLGFVGWGLVRGALP